MMRRIRDALRRAVDYVLGYDFFISYAHDDGTAYPEALCESLEKAKDRYRVFLDTKVYVAGDDLSRATKRLCEAGGSLGVVGRRFCQMLRFALWAVDGVGHESWGATHDRSGINHGT